jgi:xylulokinase
VVVDWFRREFCPGTSLAEMDKAAGDVPAGSRGLIALTDFDGTVTPVRDASARGAFFGLTLGHWRADMFRAVIESLGCVFRANLEFLRRCGFRIATVRAIGGGAGSDLWLQTMADVSGVAVNRPAVTEAAVLGAAVLAGAGAGDFGSVAECSTVFYRDARSFDPDPSRRGVYRELYRRHVDLSRRLGGT